MKKQSLLFKCFYRILNISMLFFASNFVYFLSGKAMYCFIPIAILMLIFVNVFSSLAKRNYPSFRLRLCSHGSELLLYFAITIFFSFLIYLFSGLQFHNNDWKNWTISLIVCVIFEAITFWNGIISVYCTSSQLGVSHRVIGIILGWVPIANLVALWVIISITLKEVNFEIQKNEINFNRKDLQICKTKYPILLIHGVFFRDSAYFNYWGRVPEELIKNGATIYYGNHCSASSVKDSAEEISAKIKEIVEKTGCEKVNIIAHSKGGLDCRYAISHCGVADYVASLTTVNTPHRGCGFADYLLYKLSDKIKNNIANTYNNTLTKLGDKNPDFIAAVTDLTEENCRKINAITKNIDSVYYQSVGSKLNYANGGTFPLNFSYHLVKYFNGANDGLVDENSFIWGSNFKFVTVKGKRGVSHADVIDLNRQNIKDFDVREFYVQLVSELKSKGY